MAENHKGFPQKGLQSAAHRLCAPMAHKVHTCSLKSIFSHAHVVRENDLNALPPAGSKLCEAFSTGHFLLYYTVKVSLFLNIL